MFGSLPSGSRFLRFIAISLFAFLASCETNHQSSAQVKNNSPVSNNETKLTWKKLLDNAPWKANYNFQMLTIGDKLWTFHPDGNWWSTDGVKWTRSELVNSIDNLAFLDYVQFGESIYGLGNLKGNIERYTFKSEIYKTNDLKDWATISKNSNLPNRFFYHPFVFDNKIWIIGGEDKTTKYSDIWNSPDGINWTKQKENLPFGKRSGSQIVDLKGKLFLLDNDVWSSTDGLNWQMETPEIVKGEQIFGYNAVVFENRIWLLGCNRNGQFSSQVLVSSDGKTWEGQDAPWTPRGGIASTVYKGKIYMTGGKYGGTPNHPDFRYSNDVWTLSKE